jgi:hypothetical protein
MGKDEKNASMELLDTLFEKLEDLGDLPDSSTDEEEHSAMQEMFKEFNQYLMINTMLEQHEKKEEIQWD